MALSSSKQTRTFTASGAVASGSLPSASCGRSAGMDSTASAPEDALSAAADAALVTRDSVRTEEMLSSSKTLEMALPLVYHSGALLHSLPQSKAVRPAPEHPRPGWNSNRGSSGRTVPRPAVPEWAAGPPAAASRCPDRRPPARPRGRGQRRIDEAELSGRTYLGEGFQHHRCRGKAPLRGGGSAVLNGHGHRTLALPLEGKAGERSVGAGVSGSLSLGRKAQPASSAAAKMRQSAVRIRFIVMFLMGLLVTEIAQLVVVHQCKVGLAPVEGHLLAGLGIKLEGLVG